MSDVFISYKAEDRARVRPLVEALQADGISVWWDAHLGAGEQWRETIESKLAAARCVIVVWSKRSTGTDGRFVRDEASRAARRGVYLPITIDRVDPPLGFGETQCLPLSGWKGDREDPRYLALLDAARHMGGGDQAPRDSPAARAAPAIDRRLLLAGGGAAVGLAALGGGWWWSRHAPAQRSSIAVLPFANLSGDPAQAYFSDGLAEELRSALSRIPGLQVMARTSSEMVRDSDAKVAAAKLGVATILTGSVRRSPATIRVSAQLVDGSDGLEQWSQMYDRAPGDVLQVQTSIAESVAEQLRGRFAAGDRRAVAARGTTSAEAQDLVLQAQARSSGDEGSMRRSLALADAAIALDPNYALAYAVKGRNTALLASFYAHNAAEARAGLQAAEPIAMRAIALDPNLPQAHATLAVIRRNQLNLGAGLAELAKAVSLPDCPIPVATFYASSLAEARLFGRALQAWEAAARRDPLNPDLLSGKAMILANAGRYAEAMPVVERYLKIVPDDIRARNGYAINLMLVGRTQDSARQFALLPAGDLHRTVGEAIIALHSGDRAGADRGVQQLHAAFGDGADYQYAQIAAQAGNVDEGIKWLEGAWTERDPGLPRIKVDPWLDPLRKDPRFDAIVARLNFPA